MYGHQQHQPMDRKSANRQMQEAATQRKAANDTQYFWDLVNRHMSGHPVGPRKVNRAQEEHMLFTKKAESVSQNALDDSIPVQRSGPRSDEVEILDTFSQLEGQVPPTVTKCIELLRYENPTPIQKHAIPLGLAGLDLMCCAQTGSGKTFAFLVPVVAAIDPKYAPKKPMAADGSSESDHTSYSAETRVSVDDRGALPKAVVLAPTRELASQIHLDARRLTYGSATRTVCVYGGNDIRSQLQELCVGCELIVATPGRLNDLVDRGIVSLSQVSFLVLDEADRMLDMGFEPQIRKIVLEYDMPRGDDRQTFLFSATFPSEIQALAREFLRNYVWIAVGRVGSTVENIKQQVFLATSDPNDKVKLLLGILDQTDGRTLIFVQKKKTASWLCESLRNYYGVNAEEIHGDRSQAQRENALKMFRDGHIRILVATDVAARGLDVPAVMHVIQFDMPLSAEDFDVYVHRIGRTGRAGMPGLASSFFVPGREVGEGNGKIAPLLLQLLQENNQEVPEWFSQLEDCYTGNNGGGYQRRPGYQNRPVNKFGYHDTRANQQNMIYQGGNGYDRRPQNNMMGMNQQRGGNNYGQQHQNNMYGQSAPRGVYQPRGMNMHQQQPPQQQMHSMQGSAPSYGQQQQQQQQGYYPQQASPYHAVPPTPAVPQQMANPYSAPAAPQMHNPAPAHSYQMPAAPAAPQIVPPAAPHHAAPYQPTGGYYDPYSGTFVPSAASLEAVTSQFNNMSMQQQPWMVPPPGGVNPVSVPMAPQVAPVDDRNRRMNQPYMPQQGMHNMQARPMQAPRPQMQQQGGYGNMGGYGGQERMYSNAPRPQYGNQDGQYGRVPYGAEYGNPHSRGNVGHYGMARQGEYPGQQHAVDQHDPSHGQVSEDHSHNVEENN